MPIATPEHPSTFNALAITTASNIKHAIAELGGRRPDGRTTLPLAVLQRWMGFNTRFDTAKRRARVEELRASMVLNGFSARHPLGVVILDNGDGNKPRYSVLVHHGDTRLEAAHLAQAERDLGQIPVVITQKSPGQSDVDFLRELNNALVTDNESAELSLLEQGLTAKRSRVLYGQSVEEIARDIGKSAQHVRNVLLLADAPEALQGLVFSGSVKGSTAIEAIRQHGADALSVLTSAVNDAEAKGKSVATASAVESAAKRHVGGQSRPRPATFDAAVRKKAPTLFEVAREISADQGYASLSKGVRERLEALISELAALQGTDPAGEGKQDAGHSGSSAEVCADIKAGAGECAGVGALQEA